MKIENIKKISDNSAIIKQVYSDRVLIRTNNIIYSNKYNSFILLLSNTSCLCINNIEKIKCREPKLNTDFECYLVEIYPRDFEEIKTYDNNFEKFYIDEKDEIKSYNDLVKLAQEQENLHLITKFITQNLYKIENFFKNINNTMKISYDCEDLIEELEADINEFGNIDMYAFFKEIEGYTFLVDYDFIEDKMPLTTKELENCIAQIMKAKDILKILIEQNSII